MDSLQYISLELTKVVKAGVAGESDLPALLFGIVVAYLTILISVAIAIFSEKKEFEALDRNVILDHIIKAKNILLYLGLTFLPLLFWNNSLPGTRILEIFFWGIGVFFITNILINSYHWMKGNKFRFRFCYLIELQNSQDIEESWRSVWHTKDINFQNEQKFFNIFNSTVNKLLENDKNHLVIASKLLGDFKNFSDNRSTTLLIWRDETLDNILQWHFWMWKKEREYLNIDAKIDEWSIYNELSRTIDSIFLQIETRALTERGASPSFFRSLERHAKKCKNESEPSVYFRESLFGPFYQVFFQKIYDAPDRYNIWNHHFPKKWKVTKNNLQGTENIIAQISLYNFLEWAQGRIWQTSKEKDFSLDDISSNLFPEVDPVLWAKILIFIFSPYGEDRLRSVIERSWNFGFIGRVKVFNSGPQEDEIMNMYGIEEINTFDLSCILFKDHFSRINLESYLKSLEQLSYPKESEEERRRLSLHSLFTKMLDFAKNKE